MTDSQYLKDKEKRLEAIEARYANTFYKALLLMVEPAVTAFEHIGSIELAAARVTAEPLKQVLKALHSEVVEPEVKAQYYHLLGEQKALPVPLATWIQTARAFLTHESSKAITAITASTRNLVKRTLKEQITVGGSIPEQASALRATVAQFSRKRAILIARTESLTAQNYSSFTGALATGLQLDKIWLAASDGRTRDTHAEANGQRVDISQLFNVGGDSARFPGDPNLSAAERCNCRCSIMYKPKQKPIQTSFNF